MDGTRPLGDRVTTATSSARFAQTGGRAQESASAALRASAPESNAETTPVDLLAWLETRIASRSDAGVAWTRLLQSLRVLEHQNGALSEPLAVLMRAIVEAAFEPGRTGPDLRSVIAASGLFHESLLSTLVGAPAGSPGAVRSAASELATLWVAGISSGASSTDTSHAVNDLRSSVESMLVALSTAVVGANRDGPSADAARPLSEILRDIARVLKGAPHGAARDLILDRVEALSAPELEASAEVRWLRILSGSLPLSLDSIESSALARHVLSSDLKHKLLESLSSIEEGPARDALSAALVEIESAQLARVAAARQGALSTLPLLMRDGAAVQHVRLLIHSETEHEGASGSPHEESSRSDRLAIATDFSALGPVEAEVTLRGRRLSVRVRAARHDAAQTIQDELPALRERLCATGLAAEVSVEDRSSAARAAHRPNVSLAVHGSASLAADDMREHIMDMWA